MLYKIFNYIISMIFNGMVLLILYIILYIILCDLPIDLKFFIDKLEFNYVDILCLLVFFTMGMSYLSLFIKNFRVMRLLIVIPIFLLVYYLVQGIKITFSEYENIITIWEFTFAREPSEEEIISLIQKELKEYPTPFKVEPSITDYFKIARNSFDKNNIISLKKLSDNTGDFLIDYLEKNFKGQKSQEDIEKMVENLTVLQLLVEYVIRKLADFILDR